MSRTYRYPRESLEGSITRDEVDVNLRIKKRLERQKHLKKKKIEVARLSKRFIGFRNKQQTRV